MGSYDSTCAITRTAITHGDPVLVIVIPYRTNLRTKEYGPHTYLSNTYHLVQHLGYALRSKEQEAEFKEKYKSTGGESFIKPMEDATNKLLEEVWCMFGTYDDYGFINEFDESELDYNTESDLCFIHKDVVDEIVKRDTTPNKELLGELAPVIAVAHFAFLARIQLFHQTLYLGQQCGLYEKTEQDAITLANKLQRKKLRRYTKTRFNSWIDDVKWSLKYKLWIKPMKKFRKENK